MRSLIVGISLGFLLMYSLFSHAAVHGRTIPDSLHLRAGAGAQHASLGMLARGTRLSVLETRGKWIRVEVQENGAGRTGWIHADYVALLPAGPDAPGQADAGIGGAVDLQFVNVDTSFECNEHWSSEWYDNCSLGLSFELLADGPAQGEAEISCEGEVEFSAKGDTSPVKVRNTVRDRVPIAAGSGRGLLTMVFSPESPYLFQYKAAKLVRADCNADMAGQ